MRLTLLFCSLLASLVSAQEASPPAEGKPPEQVQAAEEAFDEAAPHLAQVQVEWIELPHETLTGLLFMRPKGNADATGLRKEVQEIVKTGAAKILDTQIITGNSGEVCTLESIQELIYPSAYEPAEIPNEVTINAAANEPANPEMAKALAGLMTPHHPNSFETRSIGSTLKIEPAFGEDGKLINLSLAPDLNWHTGNTVWLERKDVLGNLLKIEEPEIYSIRAKTKVTMKDRTYLLAAVLSPKNQEGRVDSGRKVMMFVKCDLLAVE